MNKVTVCNFGTEVNAGTLWWMDDSLLLHFMTVVIEATERSPMDGEVDSASPSLTTVDSPPAPYTLYQPVQNSRYKPFSLKSEALLLQPQCWLTWQYLLNMLGIMAVSLKCTFWSIYSHMCTHTIVKMLQLHFYMKTNEDVIMALVIWNYCC
jgi:hypothetical protein